MNRHEKLFQEQLRQDVEIPEIVKDRISDTCHKIETNRVFRQRPEKDPFRWMKTTAKVMGSLAAVMALAFVFCVTNPVMAKNLPLVGGLFEILQDNVSFFGNFSDHAVPLAKDAVPAEPAAAESDTPADDDTEAASGDTQESSDTAFTQTADGLTITLSEVFANSQAIYLTMLAESEEPFPATEMMENEEITPYPLVYLYYDRAYDFLDDEMNWHQNEKVYTEGMFLDDNTYSCILRIDLDSDTTDTSEFWEKNEELSQQILDEMGITTDDINDETEEGYANLEQYVDELAARQGELQTEYTKKVDIPETFTLQLDFQAFCGERKGAVIYPDTPEEEYAYRYEGPWSFEVPITIDDSQTEVLELNETNADGIGLEKVVRTPYEITVYDKYDEGAYSDTFLVALDANGNKLPYNESNGSCDNFAIQDRDISTVDIYILDYIQYMDELKGPDNYNNNENKPEEEKWSTLLDANALYHKTIQFDTVDESEN